MLEAECRSVILHKERVFAASFNKGVFIYNAEHQLDTIITEPKRINSMSLLNENQLWVATDDNGIWVVDADEPAIRQRLGKADGLSVLHIRKCIKDRQANIWMATSGGGLYKYAQNNFNIMIEVLACLETEYMRCMKSKRVFGFPILKQDW